MKLSKEEKQKVFLGALLGIGVIYGYFEFALGPLQFRQKAAQTEMTALDPKIAEAKMQIARTEALKGQVPQAELLLTQVNQMIPEGSPVAWFPTLVGDFFKSRGVERVTTRMLSDVADPSVDGYRRINWSVDMPKAEAIGFAMSLADFETQQPLIEAPGLVIEFLRDDPQWQRVSLSLTNTVKP